MSEKPLFIPLLGQYFDAFRDGEKRDELRLYGKRWNEESCRLGRPVILSRGYEKQHRINGIVTRFKKQHGKTFGSTYKKAIADVYGTLDVWIACIGIDVKPWSSQNAT